MSAVHAMPITDALRDEAPHIQRYDGRELTPLRGK
jgi:hypothetical protein